MRTLAGLCGLALLATCLTGSALADEELGVKDLPKAVVAAVKARYPQGEIEEVEQETEDGKTVYEVEVEIESDGHETELTLSLTPEGKILEIEKEIAAKDLPKAVAEALAAKYPKASYQRIEEVVKVENDKDKLDSYEVLVLTADKKKLATSVTPNGKIKEQKEAEDDNDKEDEDD